MIKSMGRLYEKIEHFKENSLYRRLAPPFFHNEDSTIEIDRKNLVNFSSNDYLGFSFDKSLVLEFIEKVKNENIEYFYFASSGSRLLSGNSIAYEELEEMLSSTYKREAALFFNSGYHANVGIFSALLEKGDVVFMDKLCHASIIDGILLSGVNFFRYNHLDYDHLETLLKKYRNNYKKSIIVTESVFSMDGDIANLKVIIELKNRYDTLLYVDEAHSVGVFGEKGLGLVEKENIIPKVELILGTFGKAFSSIGSYLICDKIIKELLINKMRSFIYTTALPPIILSWNNFIFNKSFSSLGKEKRKNLFLMYTTFRNKLKKNLFPVIGNSQIIPLLTYCEKNAVLFSEFLYNNGFYAPAIRYPTVPKGKARIRFSITANMTNRQLYSLFQLLKEVRNEKILVIEKE